MQKIVFVKPGFLKTVSILGVCVLSSVPAWSQDNAPAPAPDAATPGVTAPVPTPPDTTPAVAPTAPTAPPVATPQVTTPPATNPAKPPATDIPADDSEKLRQSTLAYNSGLAALKKSDWVTAATQFTRATQLSPNDAGAYSFLGYVRLQQKDWDGALEALQAAQDNGKDLDVLTRAQLLNNIGFARWNKNQIDQAKAAFEGALKLSPTYNDARYNLAFALLACDDYNGALPYLKQLATSNPKDATVQDGLGEALEKTGNLPGALGAYKNANTLAPQNEDYRFKFAMTLITARRPADAMAQLRTLLEFSPNYTQALLQLGDLDLKASKWDDAASMLKRYVQLKPDDFTGHFNLGVAYDYAGNFTPALAEYAEAEKLRPDDLATKNNIGRIYYKRNRLPEAIDKFTEVLDKDKNFSDARTNLATVYAAQNNWGKSSEQWGILAKSAESAIKNAGNNTASKNDWTNRAVAAHLGLANNYVAQGDWKTAVDEYNAVLKLNSDEMEARFGLGRALYNTGDRNKAEAIYRDIIAKDPKNADAYNDLGVVLEANNDKQGALDNYMQALEINPKHAGATSNVARLKGKLPVT